MATAASSSSATPRQRKRTVGAPTPIIPNDPNEQLKRNSKGGILVTDEEIQNAFNFLDIEKQGRINLNTLRKSLSVFFPDIPLKELKFLMNNQKELTVEYLSDLLKGNEITNFDPVAEAFKVRDY